MEKILYDQMDWAGIEEIVYSESSDPGRLLGAHVVKEGLLIQAFLPGARTAAVKLGKEKFPMEMADEAGWFAVLFEDKRELEPYRLIAGRFFRHFSKNFLKCPSVVTIQPVFLSKISSARTFL